MQKLKRILKIISLIFSLFLILGIGFTLLFGEEIEKIILNKVNLKLKNEISISEVEFSLFSNFPDASVTFTNILISDSYKNSSDSLLFSEKAIIKLNLFNLLSKDYSLSNISFLDGEVNIKYTESGIPNFNILKDTIKSTNNFDIDKLELINFNFLYHNIRDSQYFKSNIQSGILSLGNLKSGKIINLNTILFTENLNIQNLEYLHEKSIVLNTSIHLHNDSISLKRASIVIDGVNFEELDYLSSDGLWVLNCKVNSAEISEIIKVVPEKFQYLFKNHILKGDITSSILVRKEKEFKNPFCSIDFNLDNAIYESTTQDFQLNEINSEGHFDNGKHRDFSTSKVKFTNFISSKKGGEISGNFIVSDLNKYYLNADIYSSWELSELNEFMDESPFKDLTGSVSGEINYNGNLSFDSKMKEYISSSSHTANLDFKNVFFRYKESPLEFSSEKMNWIIKNHIVKLSNENLRISKTNINIKGEFLNLILYLLDQKKKINFTGDVFSNYMKFEELLTITEINGDDKDDIFISVLPKWIDTKLNLNISKFQYHNFQSRNLKGEIDYNSNRLKLKVENLEMKTLDGEISASINYFENKLHDLVLKANLEINKINITEGFQSFENLGQTFITDKNIKGIATANMYIQAMWDRNYKFYTPSLNVNTQLKIEDGELIEFEPMYNLSDYVSLDELKNVKFATLENKIRIENEKIIIPEMDIHSTALSVHVSGTHSFNNIMDYKVRLLLSDVLGKKVDERKSINLNELEHNHDGKTTIQLRMKGHVDKPKISLDKLKLKEDVLTEIKKETEEIKNIIEEKILNKPNSKKEKIKEEDSDIEINWDDEK